MSGLFSPDQQNVTTTQEVPDWVRDSMQYNIGMGQGYANRPYVPYLGERFQGFNPMQQNAFASSNIFGQMGLGALGHGYNALMDGTGQNMMGGAYQGLMNFAGGLGGDGGPMNVNARQVNPMFSGSNTADAMLANRGSIRDVMGGSFLDMDIGEYMNPYTQQVIQNTTDEMNRGRQIQLNQGEAAANAAGAFGGSRHGVSDSLTNAEFFRNQGNMANQMNAQAYDAATGLMGQDLTRGLQAGLANQGMDWNVQNLNANLGTNTNQFNAGQQNQVGMFNAGQGNQVGLQNAANQLTAGLANQQAQQNDQYQNNSLMLQALQSAGGLGNQFGNLSQMQGMNLANYGMSGLDRQLSAGNQQQAWNQMGNDFDYQQWLEARDWYPNQFQYALSPLQGMNFGQNTTQPYFGPSAGQQGIGALMTAMSLYGMGSDAGWWGG